MDSVALKLQNNPVLHFRNGGFHYTRIDGFHSRTGGVKQPGILNPLFRKNLDPIIHAMLNTFLCNSFL